MWIASGRGYNEVMEMTRPVPVFRQPLLNAAGSLGFTPDLHAGIEWEAFGAFVTNPISYRPRRAASGTRLRKTAGGTLLQSGHANPGFSMALKRFGRRWANAPLPVVVHLLASGLAEMHKMILKLETFENVMAVEVGFPADVLAQDAAAVLESGAGELTLLARVALTRALELAPVLLEAGASAICLGPPRGLLPGENGEAVAGRLYGPGVFPQALYVTTQLAQRGVPVVAAGGVYRTEDVKALLEVGALAVQVDTALWRGDWSFEGGSA